MCCSQKKHLKCFLIFLNASIFIFCLIGIIVTIIVLTRGDSLKMSIVDMVGYAICLSVGILGWIGAAKESRGMLLAYIVVLGLAVALDIACIVFKTLALTEDKCEGGVKDCVKGVAWALWSALVIYGLMLLFHVVLLVTAVRLRRRLNAPAPSNNA